MAIIIEQDKLQAQAAYRLQTHADLDSIRIMEGKFVSRLPAEDAAFPLILALRHQAEEAVLVGSKMTIRINFGFKAGTEDKKTEVIAIGCRVEVTYDLAEGYEPTSEEIEAFKQGNAIFNCWTYFREFVQSTLSRMNYPPVAVPFLRMAPKAIPTNETRVIEGANAEIGPPTERPTAPQKRRRKSTDS